MGVIFEPYQEQQLLSNIARVASILRDVGRDFNQHLLRQFQRWDRVKLEGLPDVTALPPEHLLFLKAAAQALQWLQQLPVPAGAKDVEESGNPGAVPVIYLRLLLEARAGLTKDVAQRLAELLGERQGEAGMRKPRRLLAVIAGLETWAKVKLPEVTAAGGLNLEEVQRLALDACGRARWTALAPLKMYAIYKSESAYLPTSRDIFPPMGTAVSRGIERVLGFRLGESENDYTISRGLHLKLVDLAQTTIWEINSGFYRLGGGV